MASGLVYSLPPLALQFAQPARSRKFRTLTVARKKDDGASGSGGLGQAPLRMESIEQRQVCCESGLSYERRRAI